VLGLSLPADAWHESAWDAACAFVEKCGAQVEAVAEALAEAGDVIRARCRAALLV